MKGEKKLCHQHRGGDIMTETKWEYWEELYTLWRAIDREQSLISNYWNVLKEKNSIRWHTSFSSNNVYGSYYRTDTACNYVAHVTRLVGRVLLYFELPTDIVTTGSRISYIARLAWSG